MVIHGDIDGVKALKLCCAACATPGAEMNKEHFWPRWLILRTKTNNTSIRWLDGKRIGALGATIPLCKKCNSDFGEFLEKPVSEVFNRLETGMGLSDDEAELLIRWLWKFEGLAWLMTYPVGLYSSHYLLRERVLGPIAHIRGDLLLAVSLIENIEPQYGDAPLGLDSINQTDAIFVSGVFSRIAMMVLLRSYEPLVPKTFSIYHLIAKRDPLAGSMRLFYPKVGFKTDTDAVGVTKLASIKLSAAHEELARRIARLNKEEEI